MAISRVQKIDANNGVGATSISATLASSPTNGNFLVAGVITAGSSTGRVSSISQTGATWVRAVEIAATGVTNEIWYAENVSSAGTGVTVNLAASLRGLVTVAEYSGVKTSSSLDKTATNSGTYGGGGGA